MIVCPYFVLARAHTQTHIYRMYTLFLQLHAILSKNKCFYLHFFSRQLSHTAHKQMEIAESRKQITFMLYVRHFCFIKYRQKMPIQQCHICTQHIAHRVAQRVEEREKTVPTKVVPLNIHRELNLWLYFFLLLLLFPLFHLILLSVTWRKLFQS